MNNDQLKPLSEEEEQLAAGYVLGDLTDAEVTRLEQLLADNPALQQEIQAVQTSLDLLSQALPTVQPPASLRAKIVASPAIAPPSARRSNNWVKGLAGLGAIALLLLGADNWRLRYQLGLAQQVSPDRVAAILQQPNSRLISLTGNDSAAAGTLLFTPGRWQEVIVSFGDLPPLPPDQIYRMWLALENGEIIYCGEFNTESDGSVFVRFTPPETPPQGVKATELFVTIDASAASPDPAGTRVMQGTI